MNLMKTDAKQVINRAIAEVWSTWPVNARDITEVLISICGDLAVGDRLLHEEISDDLKSLLEYVGDGYIHVYPSPEDENQKKLYGSLLELERRGRVQRVREHVIYKRTGRLKSQPKRDKIKE